MIRKVLGVLSSGLLFAVTAAGVAAAPARTFSHEDVNACQQSADHKLTISACTKLLDSEKPRLKDQLRAMVYQQRGVALTETGDHDQAISDYSEAIRINPKNWEVYSNRAVAYIAKGRIAYPERGEFDQAIKDFDEAIRLNPKNMELRLGRGAASVEKGEYDRAIADFNELIRTDPKNWSAYRNRAIAYLSKGEFDRAINYLDELIRLNPAFAKGYQSRCIVWKEKAEFDKALADCTEAIVRDPANAGFYLNRGNVWKESGNYDSAIADFNEAIRLDSGLAVAYSARGESWRLKGDLDHALADQDQAVVLEPGPFVYYDRGDTLRYMGEYARAIADYENPLRSVPDFIPALTGLGLTYEKMGDFAKARSMFEQASASQNVHRFTDISKTALETARARLAALESGIAQPSIPNSPHKATSATSIPTPTVSTPTVAPAAVATGARQGRRVALVIGNSVYKTVPALANPRKDAEAIAASLRNIGFDQVTLANDATREKLIDSLHAFADEAEKADWAMVYYAGHGLEVGGINYLVPVDARLAVDRDIQFEAVPLDQVLAAVDAAKRLKLVVLDACRDNPFSPRKTEGPASAAAAPTGGGKIASRSIGRGLAEIRTAGGTLVVFAAKNGQVALDGDGDNSPFAVAMLQRIVTPGVEINKLFRLMRDDVMEATAGRQEPYTYGSLPGKEDFFFIAK